MQQRLARRVAAKYAEKHRMICQPGRRIERCAIRYRQYETWQTTFRDRRQVSIGGQIGRSDYGRWSCIHRADAEELTDPPGLRLNERAQVRETATDT